MAHSQTRDLARYRELAQASSLQMRNPQARAIFDRMLSADVRVDWMRDEQAGMFMAPFVSPAVAAAADIVCVGIPMEKSVPLRFGTAKAPGIVREWSQWCGPVHEPFGTVPFDQCSIVDMGDLDLRGDSIDDQAAEIQAAFTPFADAGANTFAVGGEHTMTLPILRSLAARGPLGLVIFDAHSDTGGGLDPDNRDPLAVYDASWLRLAVVEGLIDPERCIQIGLRGRTNHFWDFGHETGMRMISADDFAELGVRETIAQALEVVGDGPCYLTLDSDVIDPIDLPGVGLPEPFGVRARDVRDIIRGLRGLDVVGADLTELAPLLDPTEQSGNIAAHLCFEMLAVLADARARREGMIRQTDWSPESA
ncbi:arginase family protein [Microbacterium sp. NPDC089695]|uniref:arginase family protein n=1 Tax=Microbacterium sp. NPDC089695 TaxID=3364198 RepID=UPI0038163FED